VPTAHPPPPGQEAWVTLVLPEYPSPDEHAPYSMSSCTILKPFPAVYRHLARLGVGCRPGETCTQRFSAVFGDSVSRG